MPQIERKTFGAADLKVANAPEGIVEAIVSVFHNVDGAQEVVMPGFFADSIASRRTADGRPRAKGVWSHDWNTPVGKTLEAVELAPGDGRLPDSLKDLGGLWVRGQFNLETQRGREAFSDLQFGSVDEFSIGYSVLEDRFDPKTGIRYLLKGEWFEWSPVLVGMNDATVLIGTKAAATKAYGAPDGSYEELSSELGFAFSAQQLPMGQDGYAYIVGTFADYFIGCVWRDDLEPTYWNVPYVRSADGTVTLGTAVEVEAQTEFVPVKGFGFPYDSHGGRVALSVQEFVKRSASGSDVRRKEGRAISEARRGRMAGVRDALRSGADEIDAMLTETAPPAKALERPVLDGLYAQYLATQSRLNGVAV